MNKFAIYLSISLFCCFLFSCGQEVSRKELKEAERLMLSAPDSALHVLESIPAPEKMRRADYAAYCLLLTEAEETLRAENLYNDQKNINEKEKMEQEHRRDQYIITCLSFLSVFGFLFTVVLFLYQRKRKAVAVLAKEKQLRIQSALYQKSMERIKDNEEQLIFLKSKLDALDQTEKEAIKTRIDILEYEKLVSSPVYVRLKEGEFGILKKKEIWLAFKQAVDEIDGCLETKLRGHYLGISQREIEVCYLLKASFSISEIANLMGTVASSVSKCRKRLYEKIHGSAGTGKDLDQFIDSL